MLIRHYSLVIEPRLVHEIDELIKQYGLFSSRSDFIRDAIRARLIEVKKTVLGKEIQEDKEEVEAEEQLAEEAMEEIDEYMFGGVH